MSTSSIGQKSFSVRRMFTKADKTRDPTQPQSTSVSSPSAATMPDNEVRVLIGLVEGDSTVFEVKVPIEGSVLGLKKLVWEEGKNTILCNIDAAKLMLFKVSMS